MSNTPLLDEIRRAMPPAYAIAGHIQSGGQGAVFRGTFSGTAAAIKIFFPSGDARRVNREISLLQGMSCSSLVSVLDATTITLQGNQCPLVAYEFHDGGDLSGIASDNSEVPIPDILNLGRCVADAINELWNERIVHRDVKPANIVRSNESEYVLVDVGLARHLDLSDITVAGGVAGTRGYMSPEQAKGRRSLTIRSDMFSLGIVLYQMASKSHPFNGQQGMIGKIRAQRLTSLRSDIPGQLAATIHRMLDVVPSRRPIVTAETFEDLLAEM